MTKCGRKTVVGCVCPVNGSFVRGNKIVTFTQMARAFHPTQEPSGEITVRRVNSQAGASGIFMFKNTDEMRIVLREDYQPEELQVLFNDLAKTGSVVFHADSLK